MLPRFEHAYNNRIHEGRGKSPYYLVFGQQRIAMEGLRSFPQIPENLYDQIETTDDLLRFGIDIEGGDEEGEEDIEGTASSLSGHNQNPTVLIPAAGTASSLSGDNQNPTVLIPAARTASSLSGDNQNPTERIPAAGNNTSISTNK